MKLTATIPSFRVSTQLKQQLTEAAKELGGRRSYAIRQALQIGLPELLKRMRPEVPDYPPGSLTHLCTPERDAEMLAIHRATSHVPPHED